VEANRADPTFVRWISSKDGSRIAVPEEMLEGPVGRVFAAGSSSVFSRRIVEEVS
jgi:Ino eighty subunit 2